MTDIYQIETTIPVKYRNFELENLIGAENIEEIQQVIGSYVNNLVDVEKTGHNLYIYSEENGSGKTCLGYYILKKANSYRHTWNHETQEISLDKPAMVAVKFGIFLNLARSFDEEDKALLSRIHTAPFLLVDDVSPWASTSDPHSDRKALTLLTMYRLEHMLPTIYTSNLTPVEFSKMFDATISSKFMEDITKLEVRGKDARPLLNRTIEEIVEKKHEEARS
jgi:DNA replication protein DnaC